MWNEKVLLLALVPFPVGEATAGKASRSLAQHIPGSGGVEGVKGAAGSAIGELARARIALDERGQKLGELDDKTARMMASAEAFSKHAHEVSVSFGEGVTLFFGKRFRPSRRSPNDTKASAQCRALLSYPWNFWAVAVLKINIHFTQQVSNNWWLMWSIRWCILTFTQEQCNTRVTTYCVTLA